MKILIAPDSFKGSLSAVRFCEIAREVITSKFPSSTIVELPMADGGEGTLEALVAGTGGEVNRLQVTGPMGERVAAEYGFLGGEKTAIVEMAQASGLPSVAEEYRNPLVATTYGTGELIKDALDKGAEKIILALGGSATNDGGAGALQALGLELLDEAGRELGQGGGTLTDLASIDLSGFDVRVTTTQFTIASDVTNPLLGERGATMTYGPQKGANHEQLRQLERGLHNFANVTARKVGLDHRETPGSGAAGGMGFGFLSYCGADIESGFELVARMYKMEHLLEENNFSFILTGEGEINDQSVQGKLLGRIAKMGKKNGIPVVAMAGGLTGDMEKLYESGIVSMASIVPGPIPLRVAMEDAELFLRRKVVDFCELIQHCSAICEDLD